MAISLEEKVNFLKSRAMFRGLDGEEIAEIASLMDEFHQEGDRLVYAEGDKGSVFYIIYHGSVRVWRQEGEQEREIMILESGDKFGEGALIDNTTRSVTVNTLEDTDFLVMHKENFEWMIDQYPEIEQHLIDLLETREQIRDMYFPWMHSGEVIYIFTRRHPAVLWINLLKPFAVLLVSGFFFYISTLTRLDTLPTILGFTLLIFFVIWN